MAASRSYPPYLQLHAKINKKKTDQTKKNVRKNFKKI
jgi:hypothetical protein